MDKIKDFNQIVIFAFLTIIIVSFVYNFYIDNIHCAGTQELLRAACDANQAANKIAKFAGRPVKFDAQDRRNCFCGYR